MNKKHWILASIGVFIFSIGYTGVKGGLFTIATGGSFRVWGPPGTAWGDNTGVSVACLMAMPLIVGFAQVFARPLYRLTSYGTASMFFATILGTQSRGGLVGLSALAGAMILRSQRKVLSLTLVFIFMVLGITFMPQSWHDRMGTIQNYEQDTSASTRIIQWKYAIDISLERPFFGNGFDAFFYQPYYRKYVASKDINRAVHSNYFQVLGEHGYIGLAMFLSLLIALVVVSKRYAKMCAGRGDLKWAASLVGMVQFSVIGFSFNGLTVNVAYLDLFYYVIAFTILLTSHIRQELGLNAAKRATNFAPGQHGVGAHVESANRVESRSGSL